MTQPNIFEEDEVILLTGNEYKCGLVCSEFISSDEEDDNEFSEFRGLKKGTIAVAWHPEGNEEVVPESHVGLVDRSLMPGDVVRRLIAGQDSQRGYVRQTDVMCHVLLIGKRKVVCNVNSKDLIEMKYWDTEPGDITLDSWVGKIEMIHFRIVGKFNDGAKFCMETNFIDDLSPLWQFDAVHEKRSRESEFYKGVYYEGQQLYGKLGYLKEVTWLKSTKKHSSISLHKHPNREIIITVEKVEVKEIEVHWLCRGYAKRDDDPFNRLTPPSRCLYGSDLKRIKKLDCFQPSSIEIGDRSFFVIQEDTVVHSIPVSGHKPVLGLMRHPDFGDNHLPSRKEFPAPTDVEKVDDTNDQADVTKNDKCDGTQVTKEEDTEGKVKTLRQKSIKEDGSHKTAKLKAKSKKTPADYESDSDSDLSDSDSDCSEDLSESELSGGSSDSVTRTKKKRRSMKLILQARMVRRKRMKKYAKARCVPVKHPSVGERVPVEVIYTYSTAEVMWQDGTIEKDVPSQDLTPIHHLDELEFFPGDYVLRDDNSTSNVTSDDNSISNITSDFNKVLVNGDVNTDATDVKETNDVINISDYESGTADPDENCRKKEKYGVIEKVDHAGRTCNVKWITPSFDYESRNPLQSVVSEEVSVYDIKDHPDYKFRPGNVVVRVGGYEESHSEAVGQVYELKANGQIMVQWANEKRSFCYPQELYLVADELWDWNSDETSTDDESDTDNQSDCSSEMSWETEREDELNSDDEFDSSSDNEQEADIVTQKTEDLKYIEISKLNISQINEMENVLCTEKDELVAFKEQVPHVNFEKDTDKLSTYKTILCLYSNLRHYNRIVEANTIDALTVDIMSIVRRELKRCKAAKMTQHVHHLYANNCKNRTLTTIDEKDEQACVINENNDGENDIVTDHDGQNGIVTDHDGQKGIDNEQDVSVDSGICERENGSAARKTAENGNKNTSASDDEVVDPREICRQACDILDVGMCKIYEKFNLILQHMKNSGRLRVLEAHDEDEDDEDVDGDGVHGDGGHGGADGEKVSQDNCNQVEAQQESTLEQGTVSLDDAVSKVASMASEAEDNVSALPVRRSALNLNLELTPTPTDASNDSNTPQTPADIRAKLEFNPVGFTTIEDVAEGHKFLSHKHQPDDAKAFFSALKRELKLLGTSLPKGIYVKGFDDRLDLYTVMIKGSSGTPYEDGLFFFDIQLPSNYPVSPPVFHYHSFCSDRLNPNLYPEGRVCVSLLGTWSGKGTEVWSTKSSLLQVLISIQGLILVSEPYYNEAGYEKQKGTQQGAENSRMYNEMALLKLVQSMKQMALQPPTVFKTEVREHFKETGFRVIQRIESWLDKSSISNEATTAESTSNVSDAAEEHSEHTKSIESNGATCTSSCNGATSGEATTSGDGTISPCGEGDSRSNPGFPLFPCSKGFQLTMRKALLRYRSVLQKVGIQEDE